MGRSPERCLKRKGGNIPNEQQEGVSSEAVLPLRTEIRTKPPEVVFLASSPLGDELELLFQIQGGDHFRYIVQRTVLGIGFPLASDYGQMSHAYVCVIAERVWQNEVSGTHPPERQYIVIDEAECTLVSELTAHCVRLKDVYRCSAAFCPNDPPGLVDGLKRAEGLSHYNENDPPHLLRERYPTFVSRDTRVSVRDVPVDIEVARKDINVFLDAELEYPGTDGVKIYGNAEEPRRKLITLASGVNFHSDRADMAIQRSEPKYLIPVWLAASGLDRSMARSRIPGQKSHRWQGSEHSGY